MKKWLLLVSLLLGLSLFCSGQAVTTLDQNCNVWGANPTTSQCGGTTAAASGAQLFFPDIRGTITNQFEVVVQGTAPGSLTVTIVGCMRGGTCSGTLASSSGTASQIITPTSANLNIYDKYGVTVSWTGGDATTRFVVNRTGTVARLQGGSGATSWSTITAGTNTNTGTFTENQTGTFTSAGQSDNFVAVLNGSNTYPSSNCTDNPTSFKFTNAVTGIVCVPSGSTGVTNSYANAVAGWCWANNSGATGQFGFVGCVGLNGSSTANANNAFAWGANLSVGDAASQTGNHIYGNEVDVQVANNTTQGFGVFTSFRGNGQPTGDNLPAFYVQTPQGTGTFTSGYECQDGSVWVSGNQDCFGIGQLAGGTNSNSQTIQWSARDAGAQFISWSYLNKNHVYLINNQPLANDNQGGLETMGIAMTATATLSANQLVKIDTANADSVVVCTTTDTQCHGFVISAESANVGLCGAASTHCPVAMGSGNKVKGILGTGTCAIGNNVIVDTTTNGRVKCTASTPAQGAWIGIAISAQAVVGSNVDVLTKFQ